MSVKDDPLNKTINWEYEKYFVTKPGNLFAGRIQRICGVRVDSYGQRVTGELLKGKEVTGSGGSFYESQIVPIVHPDDVEYDDGPAYVPK